MRYTEFDFHMFKFFTLSHRLIYLQKSQRQIQIVFGLDLHMSSFIARRTVGGNIHFLVFTFHELKTFIVPRIISLQEFLAIISG